jgi:DNA-directed RNA polymerase specialized sigma24 family protein
VTNDNAVDAQVTPGCVLPMTEDEARLVVAVAQEADLDEPIEDFLQTLAVRVAYGHRRNAQGRRLTLVASYDTGNPCGACTVIQTVGGVRPCQTAPPLLLGPALLRAAKERFLARNEGLLRNSVSDVVFIPTEDILQDVRAHAFKQIDRFEPQRGFTLRSFVRFITRREAQRSSKNEATYRRRHVATADDVIIDLKGAELDNRIDLVDSGLAATAAAKELDAVVAEQFGGMSTDELVTRRLSGNTSVAEAAGVAPASVRRVVARVRTSREGQKARAHLAGDDTEQRTSQEEH